MPHVLNNGWDQRYLIQTIRKFKTINLEKKINYRKQSYR